MVLLLDVGLFAVMTVPTSGVLYQRWAGDQEKVDLWRKICFGTDLAVAGGVALYGLYLSSTYEPNPDHWLDFDVGKLYIFAAALYGLTSLVELIPFSSEPIGASDLTILPLFSINSKSMGLALQYHY